MKHCIKYSFVVLALASCFVSSAQILIPYRKGELWGYANQQKEIKIEPVYQHVELFEDIDIYFINIIGKEDSYKKNMLVYCLRKENGGVLILKTIS
jgi:hypothetical protein